MSNLEWRLHHREEDQMAERKRIEAEKKRLVDIANQEQRIQEQRSISLRQQQEWEAAQQKLRENNRILHLWQERRINFPLIVEEIQFIQKFDSLRRALGGNYPYDALSQFPHNPDGNVSSLNVVALASQIATKSGRQLLYSSGESTGVWRGDPGYMSYKYTWSDITSMNDIIVAQILPTYSEKNNGFCAEMSIWYEYWQLRESNMFKPKGFEFEHNDGSSITFDIPLHRSLPLLHKDIDDFFVTVFDKFSIINAHKDILDPLEYSHKNKSEGMGY